MTLCSYNHEEICHESTKCPLCYLAQESSQRIKMLEQEVEALTEEANDLRNQISELE